MNCLLQAKKRVGSLVEVGETIASIDVPKQDDSINLDNNLVYGENLSQDDKDRISCLISEYVDIFAPNPKIPTLVKNMQHHIVTNEALPVKRAPYRIPHTWHADIDNQISEMLENNIIRHSSSPWNAPVILVKKRTVHYVSSMIFRVKMTSAKRIHILYPIYAT